MGRNLLILGIKLVAVVLLLFISTKIDSYQWIIWVLIFLILASSKYRF